LPRVAEEFVGQLSDPHNAIEELLLRGILLEVAIRWSTIVHARAHDATVEGCPFAASLHLLWTPTPRSAKVRFIAWARAFAIEFERIHPAPPWRRAAHLLRAEYRRNWTVGDLASAVRVSHNTLRRSFQRAYGLPIREYHRSARLLRTLEQISQTDGKIEPMWLDAGFRSRKNFYRAFENLTGLTPTRFRRLPQQSAQRFVDHLAAALLGNQGAANERGRPAARSGRPRRRTV
jgi:AraC-like DNA-binding protein